MMNMRSLMKAGLSFIFLAIAFSCAHRQQETPSPEFSSWINAYTGGVIQADATIRIVFNTHISVPVEKTDRLFSFSPSMKGSVRLAGDDTVEFIPDEGEMKPGTRYNAIFRLGDIVDTGNSRLDDFRFSFATAPREVSMNVDYMQIKEESADKASVSGTLHFSETPPEGAELKILSCDYPDRNFKIRFKPGDDPKTIKFGITGLVRGKTDSELEIRLDGTEAGFRSKQTEKVTIPAIDGFRVLGARLVQSAEPYVDITFSQPVDVSSNLTGMLTLDGAGKTWTDISDNIVRLYFEDFGTKSHNLEISRGIRSSTGERLADTGTISLSREEADPAVEIAVKGNILPDSRNLLLPLRTVNLKAVDVSVVRIYENNILSFLQDNELGDDNGLRRFGRLVSRKTVRLDSDPTLDLKKWNLFTLDLSGLFRQEPGAIYRIRVTFKKDYSLYGKDSQYSADSSGDRSNLIRLGSDISEEEQLVWDEPYPYYYESFYGEGYNWRDSDNPATPSYYMVGSRFPYCNLMTSDLGIIAKSSGDGKIWVAVNNIMTAAPVEGAGVTVYNYQLQIIGKAETDGDGFALIETSGVPFAVTAHTEKSASYLKVTDGNEKSLSRFDTGGQKLENGLKCFIYGERGVWRPGDTLHISLMIDDPEDRIPDAHPVTMELYSPLGQFHSRMVNTKGPGGLYVFNVPTASDDPTGTWNAYFKVGGSSFHKALMIETVKPNRLKVILRHSGDILQAGKETCFNLSANWLTGPAAAGLEGKVEMILTSAGKTFKGFEGYVFSDPTVTPASTGMQLFKAALDNRGTAEKRIVMPSMEKAPGMMEARLISSVTESGGDESMTSMTSLYSPFPAYAGIKIPQDSDGGLETDSSYTFPVVVIDPDGHPVKGHRIEYRIFRLDWSWWWERKAEELASYVNSSSAKVIGKGEFVSSEEPCSIPFRIDYPDWGRFLVYVKDLTGGHATGAMFTADWPSYRGRSDKRDPDALTMLTFSTDKKEYRTGEKATVFIPAADGGRALVSLENGRKIISSRWVETSPDKDTPYTFTVTDEMSPNFYIHISLLQKHDNSSNDLPVRMYGVQPVLVSDEKSHLYPQISMPESVRPLEEFTIKVSEKNRERMTYTLAIVDEGLLDITAFKTPDPWSSIYAREALGVRTWDLYDNIIGAFGSRLSPMASIGGDQMINKESRQDNRFNPVVKFIGPVTLDGKENIHRITLPMYVGSVRVMVVACREGAYGNAEKTVSVKTPLMVLPTLPRVMGPDETVVLPVNVFAMETGVKNVKVNVKAEGPVEISGPDKQTIDFREPGDSLVRFSLRTNAAEGTARITVTAEGNGYKASETVSVPVRNPSPYVTSRYMAVIQPGEAEIISYADSGMTGDLKAEAKLELASFPSIDVQGCLDFIRDYRYDCSEQISARGITLLSIKGMLPDQDKACVDSLVPGLLGKLYGRQLNDGGFAFWPGQTSANEWVSSMAGEFMSLAAAAGYEVNPGVFNAWKNFQKRCVRNYRIPTGSDPWTDGSISSAIVQAYRLYSLAMASAPEEGAMNRMKEAAELPDIAGWLLASAYAVGGKKTVAEEIISELKTSSENYFSDDRTFGSSLRDKAIMMESLVLSGNIEAALSLARETAEIFREQNRYTTQSCAFVTSAMGKLAEKVNTGALHAVADGKDINSVKSVYMMNLDTSRQSTEIRNMSEGPVYAAVTVRGRIPAGAHSKASSSGIGITVSWTDMEGNPVNPDNLVQGTDFKATVTVRNETGTVNLNSLALTFPIPSGWEIFNGRLYDPANQAAEGFEYSDVRDDRAIWYFDLPAGTGKSFQIRLRAAYMGDFHLPPVSCEAMYSPEYSASTASGAKVRIR